MIGFRTAKALIVDYVPDEALPIIRALGAIGVATVYHDADPKADYSIKHGGVRLLILDMVLANRGATESDPKSTIAVLITALEDLIDDGPGMVLVVCWTKHPDIKELFAATFRTAFPNIHLIDVLLVDKATLSAPEEQKRLIDQIRKTFDGYEPAALFLELEQLAHQSGAKVVGLLCDVARRFASDDPSRWPDGAYAICAALALAERGSRLGFESGETGRNAFIDAVIPLIADSMEHNDVGDPKISKSITDKLAETCKKELELWKNRSSALPAAVRAELNSKINISVNVSAGSICPGTAYLIARGSDNRKEIDQFLPPLKEATDDTFKSFNGNLPAGYSPLLIEISPPCDFAQSKGKVPKFLAGFLVPTSGSGEVKTGDHIRRFGPLKVAIPSESNDEYELVLNGHYEITLKPIVAKKLAPIFRIRSAILADLISWHGALVTRPGFLRLGP